MARVPLSHNAFVGLVCCVHRVGDRLSECIVCVCVWKCEHVQVYASVWVYV